MSTSEVRHRLWSISLRELLIGVAVFGFVFVTLKYADTWLWTVLASGAMLLFLAALVTAVVDRGVSQATAQGVILGALFYATLFAAVEHFGGENLSELDPYEGRLPVSKWMRPIFETVVTYEYNAIGFPQRFATQAEAEAFLLSQGRNPNPAMVGFNGVGTFEMPARFEFMLTAHLWWGILLAYLGGKFARFVYLRREARQTTSAA
jgi:hypothetical protein